MLFDLRSRGRRRTVRGIYLLLAILMGGGLILFGVGTGVAGGGLLNGLSGCGSSNQTQALSQAEETALRETRTAPSNPQSWADLIQARWDNAKQGTNFNASTGQFTASGRKELTQATQDYQQYLTLTKNPDPTIAELAARSYGALGDYVNAANAWDVVTLAQSNDTTGLECLAATSYAAGEKRKGDLASAKAISLIPKLQQAQIKQELNQARSQPQAAQEIVAQSC